MSPNTAKKAASIPKVDVGELAACMKRLKQDEVENADVSQPRQAMRVVSQPLQAARVVTTHQEESVPLDVDDTFV